MAAKEKIDFKYNLSLYWDVLKNYKLLFVAILILVLLLEASSVADKFLFKEIIDRGTAFADGSLMKTEFIQILLIVAGVFIGLILFRSIGKWINLHLLNRLDSRLIFDLKRKFFNHLISLDHNFHVSHKTGTMISRLTRGGRAIEGMTDTIIFNFAPLFFQIIVVGASLIYFSRVAALVVLITSIVFLAWNFFIQHVQQDSNIKAIGAEDFEKGNIADIFTNVDSIKYFGKEKNIQSKFKKISDKTRELALKHWDNFRWLDFGQSFILGVGIFLLIYFPMVAFLNGNMSLGTIVFIYTVYGSLMGPLFSFVHGMRDFYRIMADFQALFEYSKIEKEIKDRANAEDLIIKNGEIEFRNVGFNYGKRTIFRNFNLKIPKNKKIALVGHSGCGKTTLVKLLYRLYDVNNGAILIDNRDIEEFRQESLRGEMSIVPQEAILFDDTIYNNVKFSNPDASRKEVLQAMKFAQLDKIFRDFPKKENTIVGERGVKLSGGEKQRVSIARAILASKKVLVLDEATSSLDSETENEIQRDLAKLMEGRTSIIIAHRLSTIMKADKIVVMKRGKIVQMGSHNSLIKKPGEYRKLWELQKGGYIK